MYIYNIYICIYIYIYIEQLERGIASKNINFPTVSDLVAIHKGYYLFPISFFVLDIIFDVK